MPHIYPSLAEVFKSAITDIAKSHSRLASVSGNKLVLHIHKGATAIQSTIEYDQDTNSILATILFGLSDPTIKEWPLGTLAVSIGKESFTDRITKHIEEIQKK